MKRPIWLVSSLAVPLVIVAFGLARSVEKDAGSGGSIQMRESAKTLFMEAKPAAAPASAWVHRNYLAK